MSHHSDRLMKDTRAANSNITLSGSVEEFLLEFVTKLTHVVVKLLWLVKLDVFLTSTQCTQPAALLKLVFNHYWYNLFVLFVRVLPLYTRTH